MKQYQFLLLFGINMGLFSVVSATLAEMNDFPEPAIALILTVPWLIALLSAIIGIRWLILEKPEHEFSEGERI